MNADRGEAQKGSAETFFRKVKFWKEDIEGDAPPVFVGISFIMSFIIFFFPHFSRINSKISTYMFLGMHVPAGYHLLIIDKW